MLSAANNSLHKTHCGKARLLACVVLSIGQFPQKYEAAQLFLKVIINDKCFLSSNQLIGMISEGSCDIEDIEIMLKIQLWLIGMSYIILNCNDISQYFCFYCIFYPIKEALLNIRDLFQNHCNQPPNFWMV